MSRSAAPYQGVCALAAGLLVGLRWIALLATGVLSLFLWGDILRYCRTWNLQLALTDPRVASALLWWLQWGLFLAFVLAPLAQWLAARMPERGWPRWAALSALAIGMGTRGIVGPLVARAAVAFPVRALPGGGEELRGLLTEPYSARWVVALTEAWWLLPFLVVAFRAAGTTAVASRQTARWIRALLCLFALGQSFDAPYLLTAGGPRGATANLQFLAFHEGFGAAREEFGYASLLAAFLCLAALPAGVLLGRLLRALALSAAGGSALEPGADGAAACLEGGPQPAGRRGRAGTDAAGRVAPGISPAAGRPAWVLGIAVALGPLCIAWLRNPAVEAGAGHPWGWAGASLATTAAAALWTALLALPLSRWLGRTDIRPAVRFLVVGPALLPGLAYLLPLVRPLGRVSPLAYAAAGPVLLVLAAPYLYLAAAAALALRVRGHGTRRIVGAAAAIAAWATWTDLLLPVAMSPVQHPVALLPAGMAWALSTNLWRSPLSVPGWPLAWLGGALLAGLAVWACTKGPARR